MKILPAILVLSGLAGGWATGNAPAQTPKSPAGTWDFVVSGSQRMGVTFLTFYEEKNAEGNYWFDGYEIVSDKKKNYEREESRYILESGRTGIESTNLPITRVNYLFGRQPVNGRWNYDLSGKVVGFYTQTIDETNHSAVSFRATVTPGKRMSMVASTPDGKVSYNGVPISTTPNSIAGPWTGSKVLGDQSIVEMWNLTPNDNPVIDPDYPPYVYFVRGNGPGYTFIGSALLSTQKKVAFSWSSYPTGDTTNSVLSASFGSISFGKKGTTTNAKGIQDGMSFYSQKAELQPGTVPSFK